MNTPILHETRTIKAVRIHSFGGPESLCFEDVQPPEPGIGEVLVRVHAAGLNDFDLKVCEGVDGRFKERLGSWPLPHTLGFDFSGVVEALGPGVTEFFAGQPVFGHSANGGAFAELCVAPASAMAPRPPTVDDLQAAATPLCVLTAWQALFEIGQLRANQKVLIHGAAGGVGTFAVQLALRHGASVIGTASGRNLSYLRRLGVQEVINHSATRFEDAVKGVDVVLDLVGGETQDRSWKVLKAGGRLVSTVSAPSQEKALLCGVRAWKIQTQTRSDELTFMGDLIANGEIKVMVDKVLPLHRASEALELHRGGHARGKIVLTVDQDRCHEDFVQSAS